MSEIQKYLQETFSSIEQNFNNRMDTHSKAIKDLQFQTGKLQSQTSELQKQQNNWEQSLNDLNASYSKLLNSFQAVHEKLNR